MQPSECTVKQNVVYFLCSATHTYFKFDTQLLLYTVLHAHTQFNDMLCMYCTFFLLSITVQHIARITNHTVNFGANAAAPTTCSSNACTAQMNNGGKKKTGAATVKNGATAIRPDRRERYCSDKAIASNHSPRQTPFETHTYFHLVMITSHSCTPVMFGKIESLMVMRMMMMSTMLVLSLLVPTVISRSPPAGDYGGPTATFAAASTTAEPSCNVSYPHLSALC